MLLSRFDDLREEVVHFSVSLVARCPQWLSVVRVVATIEQLLSTVVDDGNTVVQQNECLSGVVAWQLVAVETKETRIVMVVDEHAQNASVWENFFSEKGVAQVIHALLSLKHVLERKVHRIIEHSVERTLVTRYITDISIEDLANLVNASSFGEFAPEIFGYLGHGVYTDTVDVVLLNDIVHPGG